jgi:glycosyltransferase involved in cell wall biosynthesis
MKNKVRLAYLVSHPIQYQAPLLREISRQPDIDLTVFFGSDFSVRGYKDRGFGVGVQWDVPLLDGYRYEFLPVLRDKARTGVMSPLNYGLLSRLRGVRGEAAFDALWVHGYSTLNAIQGILAAKALGIPVIVRAESWLGDRERNERRLIAKRLFFKLLKVLVDGVMPIGTLNEEYWHHYLGVDFPQYLMPYGVDNDYFQRQADEARIKRDQLLGELKLDSARPVILFASKLQQRKRCEDLIEAYKKLSPGPGIEPHPYLVIVGDGQERPALEKQAAGFSGVRFCGFRNQSVLPRFFDIATVLVLPSKHEPWGLIVNEAMNAGKAVIVSDEVGCHPDLITNGVEGYVFPAGNVDALAGKLKMVLAEPQTAFEMGQRGLKRISGWGFEKDIQNLRRALAAITRKIHA